MKTRDPHTRPALVHTGHEPHLMRDLMLTHQALFSVFPRLMGLPAARFGILRTIAVAHPEQLGSMEIARRLGVNAAAITRQLNDMEAEGWIARRSDHRDGRRSPVQLTAKGLQVFEKLHHRIHDFENHLRELSSDKDIATAIRVLANVRSAVAALLEKERK